MLTGNSTVCFTTNVEVKAKPRQVNPIGPNGRYVAANLRRLRDARGWSTTQLAQRLADLGRPIQATGITKIEQGDRRVDADDLVALALVLGVNPNALLLPDNGGDSVTLTPDIEVAAFQAWDWADGKAPLLAAPSPLKDSNPYVSEVYDDFIRHARPTSERLRERHTAVRAARDVMARLHVLLVARQQESGADSGDFDSDDLLLPVRRTLSRSTETAVRSALRRLVAEVEDLIGEDDGERQ